VIEDELAERAMRLLDGRLAPETRRQRLLGGRVVLVREPISCTSL
jgi:hypothetical protein